MKTTLMKRGYCCLLVFSSLAWGRLDLMAAAAGHKKEVSDLATTYLSGGILLVSYVPSNDYC
jgi:hypothetical protein